MKRQLATCLSLLVAGLLPNAASADAGAASSSLSSDKTNAPARPCGLRGLWRKVEVPEESRWPVLSPAELLAFAQENPEPWILLDPLATSLWNAGYWDASYALVGRAAGLCPSERLEHRLAIQALALGDHLQAARHFHAAARLAGADTESRFAFVTSMLSELVLAGRADAAVRLLEPALRGVEGWNYYLAGYLALQHLRDKAPKGALALADCLLGVTMEEEGAEQLHDSIVSARVSLLGRSAEALESVRALVSGSPEQLVRTHMQYFAAIKELSIAGEDATTNRWAALVAGGTNDAAYCAHIQIAEYELMRGNPKAAIPHYAWCREYMGRTLRKVPDESFFLHFASAQETSGDAAAAQSTLKEGLLAHPFAQTLKNNLAYVMAISGGDLATAERLARESLALSMPDDPGEDPGEQAAAVLDTLGWILHLRGFDAEARGYLLTAVRAFGAETPAEVMGHLATVCESLGRTREAKRARDAEARLKAREAEQTKADPPWIIDRRQLEQPSGGTEP